MRPQINLVALRQHSSVWILALSQISRLISEFLCWSMSQGVSPWSHHTGVTLRWFCLDVVMMMTLITWYHPHHIAMHCCWHLMTCCQSQTWDKDSNKWQHLHHEDLGLDHNCHKDITRGIVFSSKASASSSVYIQVLIHRPSYWLGM